MLVEQHTTSSKLFAALHLPASSLMFSDVGPTKIAQHVRIVHGVAFLINRALSSCCAVNVTQGPADEPVWRQVLQLHRDHSDPVVAQQAAAALAD